MPDDAVVSLYIDLFPDEKADLEVVARTSLAFVALVRDMAAALDPMGDVRVELTSGTEGSLSLNSVLRRIRGAIPTKAGLKTIIVAVLLWMGKHEIEWTFDKVMDALSSHVYEEHTRGMSKAEIRDLAQQITFVLQPKVAEQPKRQIFRELERDQSISGVGATTKPGSRPVEITPRSDFAARSGQADSISEEESRRTVITELPVVLVSPVLKDAERSWRFQHGAYPEFGAVMRDHEFLEALKLGRIDVPLRPGVEMIIELQTKEELEAGVWVVKERSVTKVLQPSDRGQGVLLPAD